MVILADENWKSSEKGKIEENFPVSLNFSEIGLILKQRGYASFPQRDGRSCLFRY